MKSKNYYRVRLLARILFWLAIASIIYFIATSVWWVEGGYCIGSSDTCLMGGL